MRYIVIVTTLNRLYKFHEVLKVEDKTPFLQVGNIYSNFWLDRNQFTEHFPNFFSMTACI